MAKSYIIIDLFLPDAKTSRKCPAKFYFVEISQRRSLERISVLKTPNQSKYRYYGSGQFFSSLSPHPLLPVLSHVEKRTTKGGGHIQYSAGSIPTTSISLYTR
jgi:hypothetical protein